MKLGNSVLESLILSKYFQRSQTGSHTEELVQRFVVLEVSRYFVLEYLFGMVFFHFLKVILKCGF